MNKQEDPEEEIKAMYFKIIGLQICNNKAMIADSVVLVWRSKFSYLYWRNRQMKHSRKRDCTYMVTWLVISATPW